MFSSPVGHYLQILSETLPFFSSGLYSENGPPTHLADRLSASFPHFMSMGLAQRSTARIAELDGFVKPVFLSLMPKPFAQRTFRCTAQAWV